MLFVFPDYYKEFSCIAEKCRHNCCVGWKIEIDKKTREKYTKTFGAIGERLRENISDDGCSHFVLSENDRCPFLNKNNLCDIILTLGEDSICDICREHPRFKNELPGRLETGLGLVCEEACRIVLGKRNPVFFETKGNTGKTDEIILLRDEVINILQNRKKTIAERIQEMLEFCCVSDFDADILKWTAFFRKLEVLDAEWHKRLSELSTNYKRIDFEAFDDAMHERQNEYEQLVVYLIYRYFANAPDKDEAALRACFAALCYKLIYALGALFYLRNREFPFEEQVELVRMFSCEIEYCEENVEAILDELCFCM